MSVSTGLEGVPLHELLDRLEAAWRRNRAPIADSLAPGLLDDQLDELSQEIGVLPLELREWWGWHNGVSQVSQGAPKNFEMGPGGWEFLSLELAVARFGEERRSLSQS